MTTLSDLLDQEFFEAAAYRSIYTLDQALVLKNTRDLVVAPEDGESSARRSCDERSAIELDARGVTDEGGKALIRLRDYICQSGERQVAERPVTFLATPVSGDQPIFLTCDIEIAPDSDDVTVAVYSWSPGGERAGRIPFSWRMRLRYATLIL